MFRLNRLILRNHKVLGSLALDFVKGKPISYSPYISVMIGINGIGKSQVLRTICEIFNYLSDRRYDNSYITELLYDFTISYTVNGRSIELSRRQIKYLDPDAINDLLPMHLIATSTYVLDKFPTHSSVMYKYCGIRNESTPGLVSTKGLVRKTVDWILASLDDKSGFRAEIRDLLAILGLTPRIVLSYSMRHKDVFLSEYMTPELLVEIYNNQHKYFRRRKSEIWGTDAFRSIQNDSEKLNLIVEFIRRIVLRGNSVRLHYELLDDDEILSQDRMALGLLYKIGILSYPELTFFKSVNYYDFAESSSGETTLLCQFLSIMSNIRENSLIIIDEPEQSSHPNWQINYLKWLRAIFKNYPGCHFIISTHSHFLLTDLQPDDSSLIVMDRNADGKIQDRGDDATPFCWSADDILYRVFKVRNTRNYVFEMRMTRLYSLLQDRERNKEEISSLARELKEYRINDDDPLNLLLDMALKHD